MKPSARALPRDVPSGTYIELVASLCDTRMPAVIMTLMFVAIGTFTMRAAHDSTLTALVALGTLASAARLFVLIRGYRLCAQPDLSLEEARRFEKHFALTYCTFAFIFGLFAARVLALPLIAWQMPVSIAVVGYAAGAAATVAPRPRIVVTSLMLAVLPSAGVLLLRAETSALVSAVTLMALLAGGLRSTSKRYVAQSTKATKRRAFAHQAQTDHLTGVGNRLALANAFDPGANAAPGTGIAVHYIDLDDFKAINDQLGHQVGDRILRLVAQKLQHCGRPDDDVVRLGGDEFVVVQRDAAGDGDVDRYAARLSAALNTSYQVDALTVAVGASIGSRRYAGPLRSMEALLASADAALRQQKAERKKPRSAPAHPPRNGADRGDDPADASHYRPRSEDEARAQLLLLGIAKMTWEAAPDGVVEIDSPSWRAYTGQSYDDWKGYGWLTALHPDDRIMTMDKWRSAVRDQRAVHVEYRLKGSDDRYRWMSVHAVPLHNEDGTVAKWLGVNIDIEEPRRAEQADPARPALSMAAEEPRLERR